MSVTQCYCFWKPISFRDQSICSCSSQGGEPHSKYFEWGITDKTHGRLSQVSQRFLGTKTKGRDLLTSTYPLSDSRHTTGVSVGSEVSLAACWARTDITPACSSDRVPRPERDDTTLPDCPKMSRELHKLPFIELLTKRRVRSWSLMLGTDTKWLFPDTQLVTSVRKPDNSS